MSFSSSSSPQFIKVENKVDLFLNKFRVATAQEANHFSYVGGKYFVPDDAHDEWLCTYAKQLQSLDSNLYMIERRTPVFRMYFDLDMIQPDAVERSEVLALARLCCDVFRQYFPELPSTANVFTCYVLSAPPMARKGWPSTAATEMATKTGFHLIWPFLLVNQRQSLYLREGCVFAAKERFGERQPPSNPFADVIDETVLLANGLRMVGSDKASKCMTCGGDGKDSAGDRCRGCLGAKMKPERRVYTPLLVINAATNEPDRQLLAVVKSDDDVFERVRLCTIRVIGGALTPGFRVPDVAAIPVLPPGVEGAAVGGGGARRARRGPAASSFQTSEDREHADTRAGSGRCALTRNDTQEIAPSTRLFALVNEFIRKSCPSWSQVVLIKFFMIKERGRYVAKVNGVGATYCLNAARMHTSSTVFFVIDPLGMRQRCFSRKQMPAPSVQCKDFVSVYFPLPDVIRRACFSPPSDTAVAVSVASTRALAPVNGFIDKEKQVYAIQAVAKLQAALQQHTTTTSRAGAAAATHRDPASAPAPPVTTVPVNANANGSSLSQLDLYGNYTPKQLDQMTWMELTALTKQQVAKIQETARELQAECFAGDAPPTQQQPAVIPLPAKRKRAAAAAGASGSSSRKSKPSF